MSTSGTGSAWIGVLGVIAGAVIAGSFDLASLAFAEEDPDKEIITEIRAGLRGLTDLKTYEEKVKQLTRLEDLLVNLEGANIANRIRDRRAGIELQRTAELQAEEIEEKAKADALAEQERLENEKRTAESEVEKERIEAERLAAEKAAQEQARLREKERAEEQRLAAERAREEEEQQRLAEAERLERLREQQRLLEAERVCRNASCTSWIIR